MTMPGGREVRLFAAGSLRAAFTDIARQFESETGNAVAGEFGASGLLRRRLEAGEMAHLFASADMTHPEALAAAGRAGPVRRFARNRLCALVQPDVDIPAGDAVDAGTLLDWLLSSEVRLGTSTPVADPSGDYAWALFRKAEAMRPGAFAVLDAKALTLTGGEASEKAPVGRNQYAWLMESRQADIVLTYRTNAILAQRDLTYLRIVEVPAPLAVTADYGLAVLTGAPRATEALATWILDSPGQTLLARHGFDAPAPPIDLDMVGKGTMS